MTEEANNIVANLDGLADRRSIVIYNEEWHKGSDRYCGFPTDRSLLSPGCSANPDGRHGDRFRTFRFRLRCI